MSPFIFSCVFVCFTGILINPIMLLVPRCFNPAAFPFKPFAFEKQGRLYEKLGIKKWKSHLPDMSCYLKCLAPKNLKAGISPAHIKTLIQESCVAGLAHSILAITSHAILLWWKDKWAYLFLAAYNLLFNLPYIMIQRYNRPRFLRMLNSMQAN